MINGLLDRLIHLNESIIDFPRKDLDSSIWDSDGGSYKMKPEVKKKIVRHLKSFPDEDLLHLTNNEENIHVVGSICTNQWKEDSDIDVHVVLPDDSEYLNDERFLDRVKEWFEEEHLEYVGKHPIEVYIQSNPNQEWMADGIYALLEDEWLKDPRIVPLDYDPYDDFSRVFADFKNVVKDEDLMLGEIKRDVIDYETIKLAMKKLPKDQKQALKAKLESKLDEIESGIKELYNKRKELIDIRKMASSPSSPEEAMELAKESSKWRDANATFKLVARYRYLKVIKELEKLLDDTTGELDDEDVEKVDKIVGGS
jgi:predicted nucleotidyltransferase